MIVVSVMLHSAVTGETTELARSVIHNVGGDNNYGNYEAFSCRGRDKDTLHKSMVNILGATATPVHRGSIMHHNRRGLHVWVLVAKALAAMGYANERRE